MSKLYCLLRLGLTLCQDSWELMLEVYISKGIDQYQWVQ
ncbi:protein of unknown function [Shewanella benthica]|uniref:Uncharacterized protein n=1 Tax=Shewanella benthica TaxID=43661 RepID=A0A330M090_9GAMM|nr:protein of unknown function [Shewanella benthica]